MEVQQHITHGEEDLIICWQGSTDRFIFVTDWTHASPISYHSCSWLKQAGQSENYTAMRKVC